MEQMNFVGSEFERPDRRLSVQRASEILRQIDGLEPGSVSVSPGMEIIPQAAFVGLGIVTDPTDSYIELEGKCAETLFYTEEPGPEIFDLQLKMDSLKRGQDLLREISMTDPREDNDRRKLIREIYSDYVSLNSHELVPTDEQAHFLPAMNSFLAYYGERIHRLAEEAGTPEDVHNYRGDLLVALESNRFKRMVPKDIREQVRQDIETVPIVIIDPLQAELTMLSYKNEVDWLGWYKPDKRICYVDVTSIAQYSNGQLNEEANEYDRESLIKMYTKLVTFHELFHAATNSAYMENMPEDIELSGKKVVAKNRVWPTWLDEALVEKLAYFAWSISVDDNQIDETQSRPPFRENTDRRMLSSDPNEVLAGPKEKKLRAKIQSVYYVRRLLVDSFIEKLDWEAAGLTHSQAGTLLVRAFLERPYQADIEPPTDYKKQFSQAVSKAAHPGFLNKLNAFVKIMEEDLALSVLEDPDFDPHDKDSILWLISPRRYSEHQFHISTSFSRISNVQERLSRLLDSGAPSEIIKHEERMLEERKDQLSRAQALQLVLTSYKSILLHRYGTQPRFMNAGDRLMVALLGSKIYDKAAPGHYLGWQEFEDPDLEVHEKIVANWVRNNVPSRSR